MKKEQLINWINKITAYIIGCIISAFLAMNIYVQIFAINHYTIPLSWVEITIIYLSLTIIDFIVILVIWEVFKIARKYPQNNNLNERINQN